MPPKVLGMGKWQNPSRFLKDINFCVGHIGSCIEHIGIIVDIAFHMDRIHRNSFSSTSSFRAQSTLRAPMTEHGSQRTELYNELAHAAPV